MEGKHKKQSNLREAQQVILIDIIDGDGVNGCPLVCNSYIIAKDGSILGRLDRDWMEVDFSDYNKD